jgi:hypothetical protein
MIEESVQKRYEDDVAAYEREVEQFQKLRQSYEDERQKDPQNPDLQHAYAQLEERQKALQDRFERLSVQRDILA